MDKDTKKILKEAKSQGFTWDLNRKGHAQVYDATGRRVATFSGSPSDHRSILNGIAHLRRAGFIWPPRR